MPQRITSVLLPKEPLYQFAYRLVIHIARKTCPFSLTQFFFCKISKQSTDPALWGMFPCL
jgi:hypothetical protein